MSEPVTIEAATWAPIDPPIVRMIVFMPVATPVSVGATASTTAFAIAAKANPMPSPMTAVPTMNSHWCACSSASQPKAIAEISAPRSSGTRAPYRPPIQPLIGPATSMTVVAGRRNRPAWITEALKP